MRHPVKRLYSRFLLLGKSDVIEAVAKDNETAKFILSAAVRFLQSLCRR